MIQIYVYKKKIIISIIFNDEYYIKLCLTLIMIVFLRFYSPKSFSFIFLQKRFYFIFYVRKKKKVNKFNYETTYWPTKKVNLIRLKGFYKEKTNTKLLVLCFKYVFIINMDSRNNLEQRHISQIVFFLHRKS